MKKLVLATNNQHKASEIREFLSSSKLRILSLQDFPELRMPEEDCSTFTGNAIKKAETVSAYTGLPAMADDSGLEVDFLGGRPGVRSARYAGEGSSDKENNELLLKELKGIPPEKRGARFKCVIAIVIPGTAAKTVEGQCRGRIAEAPKGDGGFGYDPLFIYKPSGLTFAQITTIEKSKVSHRGIALRKACNLLSKIL